MYEAFFGLAEKPFSLTPDPRFLYFSPKHREAFAHLEFGLRQKGGFIVVTGEVGTGKTTICRYFLQRLDKDTISAFILYPALGTTELLRAIHHDLGIEPKGTTDKALVDELHQFLLTAHRAGKTTVLVIDEAQNLSRDVLEQIRLVSNLETATHKLLQIVLIGQSELNDLLDQSDLRQLAQRVTARYHLTPLAAQEMTHYIRHRLRVVRGTGKVGFTTGALKEIHRFTKGIPRLVNLLCDRTLLAGYVLNCRTVDRSIVKRAIRELNFSPTGRGLAGWVRRRVRRPLLASILGGLGILAMAARFAAETRHPSSVAVAAETPASVGWLEWLTPAFWSPAKSVDELGFETRLSMLSPELSERGASAALLRYWDIHLGGGAASIGSLEPMPALAQRAGLQFVELEMDWEHLRALNMPMTLELYDASRGARIDVALTGLDRNRARVEFAPNDEIWVPLSALRNYWTGRARLFWKDFEGIAEQPDAAKAFAVARLQEMGWLPPERPATDSAVLDAVRMLQSEMMLEPTGRLEPSTHMALYSLSPSYRVPRLSDS